jgi:hypothetical protein
VRYLNSSTKNAEGAFGHWVQAEQPQEITALRIASGYFKINGLSAFKAIVDKLTSSAGALTAVLGANEKDTLVSDIEALIDLVKHPRPNSKIALIGFSNALFHPKVYHLTRTDGSQLAYVGSANLTPPGITGLNIEAGLLLDTRSGDSAGTLSEIASSIDSWFEEPLVGAANIIGGKADLAQLVTDGLLGVSPPPRTSSGAAAGGTSKRPSLKPLISPTAILPAKSSAAPSQPAAQSSPVATGSTPATAPAVLDVLIAEVGKGDRWKQANFPKQIMEDYFGVDPLANEHISLVPVNNAGVASPPVDTQVVHVKSVNFRIELTSVSGVAYPASGKPIAVFRKVSAKNFRYHVYMPGDTSHADLDAFLGANYSGPGHHLKRVTTQNATLHSMVPPVNV